MMKFPSHSIYKTTLQLWDIKSNESEMKLDKNDQSGKETKEQKEQVYETGSSLSRTLPK